MAGQEPPSAAAERRRKRDAEAKDVLAAARACDFVGLSSLDAEKLAAQLGVQVKGIPVRRGGSVAFSNEYILGQVTILLTDGVVTEAWPG